MTVIQLNEDNALKYVSYLTGDVAENLSRPFYRGILMQEDGSENILAGVVYELIGVNENTPTESAIRWLKIDDEAAAEILFDSYKEAISLADVKLSTFVIPVENSQKAKVALKAAGFTVRLSEGDNIIVTLDELLELPIMKNRKIPDSISPLNQMTTRIFRQAISKSVMLGRKGVCEDLSSLPLSWFDPDVSCYSEQNGTVDGLLLFHKLPSGMLTIQLMVALSGNAQPIILGMMRKFVISLEETYGADMKVVLNRHNQSSLELTEKLLPRGFGIPVYKGSRQEQ